MAKQKETVIEIQPTKIGRASFWIKGASPMFFNALSEKVKQELLYPSVKTRASRAGTLKHDPPREFVASMYRYRNGAEPTRLYVPATAFKGALMTGALESTGATKAGIGRLVWVVGDTIPVYGVPKFHMTVVRQAGMNRAPDIRTRAILPEWACLVNIEYVEPQINATTLGTLLTLAGLVVGVGDFRQEKGKGNFGQFSLSTEQEVAAIVKKGGMKQQDAAIEKPECYDLETQTLLDWFTAERKKRGQ